MNTFELPEQINFNGLANDYADSAVIASTAADILVERLMCLKSLPHQVLDLGAGTGQVPELLLSLSESMEIVALDCAEAMLSHVPNTSQVTKIPANARKMPFQDNQFDAVLANMLLPWCGHWPALFTEVQRVLKPGGILLFSTLSPYTWSQNALDWSAYGCWRDLPEMEVIGDLLDKQGYKDTVIDKMSLRFAFEDEGHLRDCLFASGWLMSEPPLQDPMLKEWQCALEVVFGHAMKPLVQPGEFHITPDAITRRR